MSHSDTFPSHDFATATIKRGDNLIIRILKAMRERRREAFNRRMEAMLIDRGHAGVMAEYHRARGYM